LQNIAQTTPTRRHKHIADTGAHKNISERKTARRGAEVVLEEARLQEAGRSGRQAGGVPEGAREL